MADEINGTAEAVADSIAAPEAVKETLSVRERVERAVGIATEDDDDPTEPVSEAPADAAGDTPERPRDEHGRFVPKDAPAEAPAVDQVIANVEPAPQRFSEPAKAAWAKAPAEVRAEYTRLTAELEGGLKEYQAKWQPLAEFDKMATAQGTTLAAAMQNYVGIENELRTNPLQGLDRICRNMGTDLRSIAAHIMGQPAPEPNVEINQLRQEVAQLRGQAQAYQSHVARTIEKQVTEFSAAHPRMEELSEHIAWLLNSKWPGVIDLPTAYATADRLNPAPAQPAQPVVTAPPAVSTAPVPQTNVAKLSVHGAPASNASPVRSKTPREAAERAVRQAFGGL